MEKIINPIFLSIKFVLNQFNEILKLAIALTIIAVLLFALSFPFTLMDNYFSSNSTYKKITTSFGEFSSKIFKTIGCTIVPGVCIPFEELSTKLKQENFICDSLNTGKKSVGNKPVIQHDIEGNLLQNNIGNNAHSSL